MKNIVEGFKFKMDPKRLIFLDDFEEDSCIYCKFGVIVPDDQNKVDFAKCQAEIEGSLFSYFFNFNDYGGYYDGYLPKQGDITSYQNLPCEGKYFEKYQKKT